VLAAEEEFEELCFEYGIELDDVVSAAFARRIPLMNRASLTLSLSPNPADV
jgi:hypothetical protein